MILIGLDTLKLLKEINSKIQDKKPLTIFILWGVFVLWPAIIHALK